VLELQTIAGDGCALSGRPAASSFVERLLVAAVQELGEEEVARRLLLAGPYDPGGRDGRRTGPRAG
jgi:hypothetical protein